MKHRVRAAMAWVMSCLMTFAMVPTAALADATTYKATDMQYDSDGVLQSVKFGPYTMTNHEQDWLGGDTELDISNLSKVANKLSQDWAPIAGSVFSQHSYITMDSREDKVNWTDLFGPDVENGWKGIGTANQDYLRGSAVDVIDALRGRQENNTRDSSDVKDPATDSYPDRYNRNASWRGADSDSTYLTSGMSYATDMDSILREMCNMSVTGIKNKHNADGEEIVKDQGLADKIYEKAENLDWMKNGSEGTTDTKALYRIVTSICKKDDRWFMNNYALIFYDFVLTPVTADGVKTTEPKVELTNDDGNSQKRTNYFENRSQNSSDVSVEVSTSEEESISNSFNKSTTIEHGSEVGFQWENTWKVGMWETKLTIHGQYNYNHAVETAYGNEKSLTTSTGSSSSSTVTLPPHTAIALEQSSGGKTTQTATYDCPMALNYKVAIVSLSAREDDGVDYVKSFSARFGSGTNEGGFHATQNLYQRAVNPTYKNKLEQSYGQVWGQYSGYTVNGINWDTTASTFESQYQTAEHINNAATQIPMFTSGATMTVVQQSKSTKLGPIQPLYELSEVKLVEGDKRYTMTVGDTMSLESLTVNGYDDGDVEYYGFKPDKGSWVLSDKNGNKIDSSDVIALDVDEATDSLEVEAKSEGTAYIKWELSEDASYTPKEGNTVTRDNPPIYPMVRINVNKALEDLTGYTIEAEGEGETFVNQTFKLPTTFKASVLDPDGMVISHAVKFEAQDKSESATVSIDGDDNFVATEAGDYQVRATYTQSNAKDGKVIKSDWLTVHVHSLTKTAAKDATCTEDGNIDYWTDDQTGDLYADKDGTTSITKEEVVKPALGHDLEHVDAAEATCTKGGNIEHYPCKRCGKFFADEQAATELGEGDVIFTDALGHDWDEGVVDPGAGCVTTGTKTYTCQREGCGITKVEEVAALGHSWGDWIESRPATDTEDGEEKRMCIYCGEEETRTIPADNHVHDLSKVDAVAPSCVTDGNIDYWLCSRCNNIYADDAAQTQINKGDEVLRATGHAWDEGTVTTDPTCTGTGIRTLTCTNQGCTATKEVEEPAHGHDMENAIESVLTEPTCTTPGRKKLACAYKDSESCTYYKTEAIDALDHAWDEGKVTTKPTCTMKGTKTYTCTREGCGQTKTEDIPAIKHEWGEWTNLNAEQHQRVCTHDAKHIEQADHKWGEGVVTKEATVKSKGTKTYTCADCGATKSESIPKVIIEGTLLNTMKAKGKTAMVISWNKIDDADGYDVYLAPCNTKSKTYKLEVVESNEGGTTRKSTIKNLKKNICYKAQVKAFVYVNGKKTYVKNGAVVHCLTSGGTEKVTNPKSIKVKKSKVTLKKGKSTQIKATVVKKDDSKRLLKDGHVSNLRYVSGNKKVATVSKSGRILAKGKGTCKVYVIASNGVKKAITVKVK